MTYLDYQATTPLAPEALAAMLPWLQDQHGNPHSAHRAGRVARAGVEETAERIARRRPTEADLEAGAGEAALAPQAERARLRRLHEQARKAQTAG